MKGKGRGRAVDQRLRDAETGGKLDDFSAGEPIKELTNVILSYIDHREERQVALEEEVALKGRVLELMHKHRLAKYADPDVGVTADIVAEKEKVIARQKKPKTENE